LQACERIAPGIFFLGAAALAGRPRGSGRLPVSGWTTKAVEGGANQMRPYRLSTKTL